MGFRPLNVQEQAIIEGAAKKAADAAAASGKPTPASVAPAPVEAPQEETAEVEAGEATPVAAPAKSGFKKKSV